MIVSLLCDTCGGEQLAEVTFDSGAFYLGQREELTDIDWLDGECRDGECLCERTDEDRERVMKALEG